MPWREVLESGDEREADRLARDGHFRRVTFRRHDEAVRHGLDPRHLRERAADRAVRVPRGPEIHRTCATLSPVQQVEADVGRDAVEPRADRRAALETVEAPPGADKRVLHRVLGLERRAEHPVAVGGQLGAMLLEPLLELAGVGLDAKRRVLHSGPSYAVSPAAPQG